MNYTITSDKGRLDVDGRGFISYFGTLNTKYASINDASHVVRILYSDARSMWLAKNWNELSPDGVIVSGDNHALKLLFNGFCGKKVTVEMDIVSQNSGFRFNTKISNNDDGVVVGIAAPCIYGFSEDGTGVLYYPDRAGQFISNPFSRFKDSQAEFKYPVPFSAQYITYNTGDKGWMLYCLDNKMLYKNFRLGGRKTSLETIQYCFVQAGEIKETAAIILKTYNGQWYFAADEYREWYETWYVKNERSSLIAGLPVISAAVIRARPVEDQYLHDVTKDQELGTYEAAIDFMEKQKTLGFEGCHLVGWHGRGHDTDYPEFKVSDLMGGPKGLKELTSRMKQLGLQVGYYTNGRLGNIRSSIPDDIKLWSIKPDGDKGIREKYGAEEFDILCPCAEGFIEILENKVSELASEYNADFIQLDQVGAAQSYLCFDNSHGHSTPASAWPEGYERMLKRLYAAGRKVNPGFWIWVEGCWEGAAQYLDLQQGGFWSFHPDSLAFDELYRYTFPGHPLMGDAMKGGIPMWVGNPSKAEVALMKKFDKFYTDSTFMDKAGLCCEGNLISAKWHKSNNAFLIITKNLSDKGTQVELRLSLDMLQGFKMEGIDIRTLYDEKTPDINFESEYISIKLFLKGSSIDGVFAMNE